MDSRIYSYLEKSGIDVRRDNICVPLAVQFVLKDPYQLPIAIYQRAQNESGLLPGDLLRTLAEEGVINFEAYSMNEEQAESLANKIKLLLLNNEVLGIAFSVTKRNDAHLISIRPPMTIGDVLCFDSSRQPNISKKDIDKIIKSAIPNSMGGLHNVWIIYPAKEKKVE